MSGLKQANHQKRKRSDLDEEPMEIDQDTQPPPSKKQKCENCEREKPPTKSLFSSQVSLLCLNMILPNQGPKQLWLNENANSIYGHQVHRTAYEKETKM